MLTEQINQIEKLGDNWDKEYNTPGPTPEVIKFSRELLKELEEKEMLPYRIAPTVEEGMFFGFRNGDLDMYLEIYNDGDVGFLINNSLKLKILCNEDITREDIIPHISKFFNKS